MLIFQILRLVYLSFSFRNNKYYLMIQGCFDNIFWKTYLLYIDLRPVNDEAIEHVLVVSNRRLWTLASLNCIVSLKCIVVLLRIGLGIWELYLISMSDGWQKCLRRYWKKYWFKNMQTSAQLLKESKIRTFYFILILLRKIIKSKQKTFVHS